jgi:hypothetical protein
MQETRNQARKIKRMTIAAALAKLVLSQGFLMVHSGLRVS